MKHLYGVILANNKFKIIIQPQTYCETFFGTDRVYEVHYVLTVDLFDDLQHN